MNTDQHEASRAAINAARHMDWQQVVYHQGIPCFHIDETTGHFCGRAKTWAGHVEGHDHAFVSLEEILNRALDHAASRECVWTGFSAHGRIHYRTCRGVLNYTEMPRLQFIPFCPACGGRVKIQETQTTTEEDATTTNP